MMRARHCIAIATLMAAATACNQPGQSRARGRTATRVPSKKKPALSVPYPVGDPVPNAPARLTLARNNWVFVAVGGKQRMPELIDRKRPAATIAIIDQDDPRAPKFRGLFGKFHKNGEIAEVDHDELRRMGLASLPPHVWLIGPEGPCRATLGQASVGIYDNFITTYDVGFELEGCSGVGYAQVGSLAHQLPAELRYVAASVEYDGSPPGEGWEHPAAQFTKFAQPGESWAAVESYAFVAAVPAAAPRPIQAFHAVFDARGDACAGGGQAFESTYGVLGESGFIDIDPAPNIKTYTGLELGGAILEGDRAEALLFHHGLDAVLSFPPTSPEGAPIVEGEWYAQEVLSGIHHPEDWMSATWAGDLDPCAP